MGRSGSAAIVRVILNLLAVAGVLAGLGSLAGCGKSSPITTTVFTVPTTIGLAPTPSASLEIGTFVAFTATPEGAGNKALTEPVIYVSSNPAVLTVAANGLACGGSWDSLTNPQVCTPGPVGIAQVTATALGVSSPATTVYVHQHIASIQLKPFTPTNSPPPNPVCQSAAFNSVPQSAWYEAHAYTQINGSLLDITPTVGQFSWAALTANVATFSSSVPILGNLVNGSSLNQVQVTASTPGTTQFYASIGTSSSVPATFETCPVQSISLTVTQSETTSKTIKATVTDILGNLLPSVPLTWSSSEAAAVSIISGGTAANNTATASITQSSGGAGTIVASCTQPTCNIGFTPSMPIYSENVVTMTGQPSNGAQFTVFISSDGCGQTDNCFTAMIPVVYPSNTLANQTVISTTPNSLMFDRQGAKIYLGTNSGLLGSKGLTIYTLSSQTVTNYTAAPGKVLAISPDGNSVIVSDTVDTPNQVFVVNTSTTPPTSTPLAIKGATAAAFSPDNLKAFIIAGSDLYVYSKLDALQTIPLTAPATDVAFLAEGAVGYLAGGNPAGGSFLPTCYDPLAGPALGSVSVPGAEFIQPLPDASGMVTLSPPNIQTFSVTLGGTVTDGAFGCPQPFGYVTVTNTPNTAINLGQGTFTAKQLLISQDGSTAYIISPNFNSVLAFSIGGLTTKSIPLKGNTTPIQADLSPTGSLLFVVAADGRVHVLDTGLLADIDQTSFTQNFCLNSAGGSEPFPCPPDLIVAKP